MTPSEAATKIGVSLTAIYEAIKQGKILAERVGGRWWIPALGPYQVKARFGYDAGRDVRIRELHAHHGLNQKQLAERFGLTTLRIRQILRAGERLKAAGGGA
jgi:excisionase family DNA binding protein